MATTPAAGTVTREQIVQAVQALGLDPENTVQINISSDRVRVIEFVRDENGNRVFNETLDGFDRRSYSLSITD